MIELNEEIKRFVLVGVSTGDPESLQDSLDELEELLKTAGGIACGRLVQNLDRIHPVTYVGSGKLDELRMLVQAHNAAGVICDDELSPIQFRNMEDALDCAVLDRTMLILDIFAAHAASAEGKLQVELAMQKYRAARLVGLRKSLSRLGGGIGTRGPGEKKLETDRRLIHERIGFLKQELKKVVKNREAQRKNRERSLHMSAALVGYTNAGKSTLLNLLTGADVLSENKLFATLDTTTRVLKFENKEELLLTDTVGFIRKLPHDVIDAFKSTLEEAVHCDLILHVVDASSPTMDVQMQVVKDTLRELSAGDKPVITVFNKCDIVREKNGGELPKMKDFSAEASVMISAKTNEGVDELKELLASYMHKDMVYREGLIAFADSAKLTLIRKYGRLISQEYREDGIFVCAYLPKELNLQ